jgi:hypothetical protein
MKDVPVKNKKAFVPTKDERAMVAASGFCLCERLPEDFNNLDDDDMDEFVTQNAWQPFEQCTSNQMWGHIDNLATQMKDYYKAEAKLNKKK